MIDQSAQAKQSPDRTVIALLGDIILDAPDPDHWLAGIAPALAAADISIGHLEVPHTHAATGHAGDVPAPGADPDHLAALRRAGIRAMTLAGNHIADCGPIGIRDTVRQLDALGIAHCGAGADLESAARPVLLDVHGRRLALLSYNCVGPEAAWAGPGRAGCAYLEVATVDGSPVAPAKSLSEPVPAALASLRRDIGAVRDQAGLVIVALHKGIVHTPAVVLPYERTLAHAAIDAGADVVIGHHAHIIRGVETYRGSPVYHGLGNGCVVTRALDPGAGNEAAARWSEQRKRLFGFEPDPAYYLAPFHPQAVHAFIARLHWYADGRVEPGLVPVTVDPPGRPRLAGPEEAARICAYLAEINRAAELGDLNLIPGDDMVVIG